MDLQANMADIPEWPINDGNPPSCIIQPVVPDARYRNDLEWDVLRTDLLHPVISGNKLFKLRLHLSGALREGKKGILTFGGAHSNHIHATAFAARAAGLASIGIIRGEEPANRSDTLRDAADWGMQLIFLSREEYRHMAPKACWELQTSCPAYRMTATTGSHAPVAPAP
jgi:1-aminocyclopropane-1-carboxylate deaminase/D-cysteine desulfhydrase-like pyridoxal-dependent ACC family enzyme